MDDIEVSEISWLEHRHKMAIQSMLSIIPSNCELSLLGLITAPAPDPLDLVYYEESRLLLHI